MKTFYQKSIALSILLLFVFVSNGQAPHVVYDFATDSDTEGWGSLHGADNGDPHETVTSSGGSLLVEAIQAQWIGIISATGLNLSASVYTQVMIECNNPVAAASQVQVMSHDPASYGIIQPAAKSWRDVSAQHATQKNYILDMPNAGGAGVHEQFSIRLRNNAVVGDVWNIRRIIFLSNESTTQYIGFDELEAVDDGSADFNLSGVASSGLDVTFTADDNQVATVTSAGVVTVVGPGTVNITASQAGGVNGAVTYDAASDVSQTLTVNQVAGGAQTITFDPVTSSAVPAGQYVELTASASSGLDVTFTSSDESIATISGNMLAVLKDGTVDITASQSGNGSWDPATDVVQTLTTSALVDLVWDFEDGTNQGWEGSNLTITNGVAILPYGGGSTYFFSEYDTLYNAALYEEIELSIKNTTDAEVFYRFRADGSWTRINFTQSNGDAEFQPYTLDLSAESGYTGAIDALQIGVQSGGTAGNVEVDNILLKAKVTSTTWDGGNWSHGEPTSDIDAVIDGSLSISSDMVVKNIEVTSNGSVNIASGASLAIMGTATGDATITRNITGNDGYSIIGAPVSGTTIDGLVSQGATHVYDSDGTSFTPMTSGSMASGDGYFVAMVGESTPSVSFTGSMVSGDVTSTVDASGFTLLANPYSAAISPTDLIASDVSNVTTGSVYLWDDGGTNDVNESGKRDGSYVVYNDLSTGDVIGSVQGFFVQANTGGSLTFTPSMQGTTASANADANYFRSTTEEKQILKLAMAGNDLYHSTVIGFLSRGTLGRDFGLDAEYLKGNEYISFYSKIEDLKMATQGLPLLNGEMSLDLGFEINEAGTFELAIEDITGIPEDYIITAMYNGKSYSLSEGPANLNLRSGEGIIQLTLSNSASILSVELLDNDLTVRKSSEGLIVNYDSNKSEQIVLYSMDGRVIFNSVVRFEGKQAVINPSLKRNQVYVLKLNQKSVKFILK